MKMMNQYYEAKYCSHSLSGVRPHCRCRRDSGEEATSRGEMKRFIFEIAGPDSDGIWEIRMMNRCYHSEAKYGTLSIVKVVVRTRGGREEGDS